MKRAGTSLLNAFRLRHGARVGRREASSKSDGKAYSSAVPTASSAQLPYTEALPGACLVSLSEPLPKLPVAKYVPSSVDVDAHGCKVTRLESGLRVVSEPSFGEFCTIGAVVDAGSRYEARFPLGVSHFLEKLAFTPGSKFQTSEDITKALERHSAIVDCQHTKDSMIYASSCTVSSADSVLELIADSVLRPKFGDKELETAKEVVRSNVKSVMMKPEPEELLNDLIHAVGLLRRQMHSKCPNIQAAYKDNTLGLPKYCSLENVDKIDRDVLFSFMKMCYRPSRTIVGGVGVAHDVLVESARRLFEQQPPVWKGSELSVPEDNSIAQYTGGTIRIEKDLSSVGQAINPFPDLGHVVVGLESCKFTDEDFVPACVLNSLMGGGGSFSAGGPGKGMYTRLYIDVLNKYHWIYNATSVNLSYADSGIFFIRASASPENLGDLVIVIVSAMLHMKHDLGKVELERAKTQLKSSLLMNLEQRPVRFEDMTRQLLGQGVRKSPIEYSEAIDSVTTDDIGRVVDRLLSSKASVVGYGCLEKLQDYDTIDRAIGRRDLSALTSRKLFY